MHWLLVITALSLALAQQGAEPMVGNIMKELAVVPDVLKEPPEEWLKIQTGNDNNIGEGRTYTPTQMKLQPKLDWNADADAFYTVMMLGPDAPSRENPIYRSWLHWLVVNVPGQDLAQGQIISDYLGPLPPKASGLLRFVVLVYQQPEELAFDEKELELSDHKGHSNFDVEKFAEKYKLGTPLAGNVFQSKSDEYSTELLRKLYNVTESGVSP